MALVITTVAIMALLEIGGPAQPTIPRESGASTGASPTNLDDAQLAQMQALRAEIGRQTQLQAYDLLDELVVGFVASPPFQSETPVVVAEVTVPLGMGSGLEALLETHLAGLLLRNGGTRMVLTHCPPCSAWVVRSTKVGTVVSRGVDQPEVLRRAAGEANAKHALFLDFEAEGQALVLRARVVSLEQGLRVVWARSLSTSTTSAALLRSGERLKTAAEAHQEYVDALSSRSNVRWPVRAGVRAFATPPDGQLTTVPIAYIQAGAEIELTQERSWTAELVAGASWFPEVHTGFLLQARIERLLFGRASSLTAPDVYIFGGSTIILIQGPGALTLRPEVPDATDLLAASVGGGGLSAITIFPTVQVGLDVRLKNRIGGSLYVETLPTMGQVTTIGQYYNFFGILPIQSFGGEVTFCF